ncbi:MAG: FAD-dependent oxidoreductase [Acholeplasmatales bacterium]|nr:FAD-dependent oxidoreductase [Acholeplasmatales bacterium]
MSNYLDEKKGFTPRDVFEEASRCLLCLDAPCSQGCPAGTDPAKFIRSVRFKNIEGAASTVRENNILAGICARVCPTEKYCEKACSRSGIDKPIQIAEIQRFLTDYEETCKMKILEKEKPNGKKVAVIGSGPAGLTAAGNLALKGFDVTVFEKYSKAGGYLTYGIPEYRLPNDVVNNEIKKIENLGVKFKFNTNVGKDVLLENLKNEYDAVIIAVGFAKGKLIEDAKNAVLAVDFLRDVKESRGNYKVPSDAVVIGGGDVAMDVCTTLKRLGVKNVTDCIYEEFSEFRASQKELSETQKCGVTIMDGYVPSSFKDNGEIVFKHRVINSEVVIKPSLTVLAIGQKADFSGLNITDKDLTSSTYQIKGTNVFYCGDIAPGDKTVVYSVKTGKECARAIIDYVGGNK